MRNGPWSQDFTSEVGRNPSSEFNMADAAIKIEWQLYITHSQYRIPLLRLWKSTSVVIKLWYRRSQNKKRTGAPQAVYVSGLVKICSLTCDLDYFCSCCGCEHCIWNITFMRIWTLIGICDACEHNQCQFFVSFKTYTNSPGEHLPLHVVMYVCCCVAPRYKLSHIVLLSAGIR